ncbi:hypothetical protein QQX98_008513 [Neonectria punicea]|uniref:GH16 domain-containing protein n=1 Tax=Neonectria punicea TaxID=979145 RepID=A0ABR1GUV7_9HYPO
MSRPTLMKHSPEPELRNGKYVTERGAEFCKKASWTFTGTSLPSGLMASAFPCGPTRTFTANNVIVRNGYLELLVQGGQTAMPYLCGQIETKIKNIKYGSVRTIAILSEPAGVVNGFFFYKSDSQETDTEWVSNTTGLANAGTRKLWFTNQDKPTTTEHEYRIDWTAKMVQFYVDGVKQWETTKNVPTEAGPWAWNNWSSGSKYWSSGPPAKDATFKIKRIDMYYDTD